MFLTKAWRCRVIPFKTVTWSLMLAMEETTSPSAAAAPHPLNSNPASTVVLLGGDPVASNIITPFGGSQGLMYSWTGPSGFSSSLRNPTTSVEGTYNLTVTEIRNGCQALHQRV